MTHYVVCSRERFLSWCHANGHDPRSSNVVHVATVQQAQGRLLTDKDEIVDIGEWDDAQVVLALKARRR